ncbi:FAR1-related sequence 5-like protein [Tanacetum coccineum]
MYEDSIAFWSSAAYGSLAARWLRIVVDESDPDLDEPQIEHLLQTAEAISLNLHPDRKAVGIVLLESISLSVVSATVIWSFFMLIVADGEMSEDECEHTLIEEIDNNGYIADEEDEMEPTNVFDQSMRYSILGKTFENLDVAYDFYNGYGMSKGFGIRKGQVNKRKKTNEIYRRIFVCNKQGYKDMNDKRHLGDDVKRRCIVRTGCEAMMQITLSGHGEWVVDKFISEHNHPLDPPSHVLKQRSHSIFHRSHECKDVVTLLSKAGMKPSDITKTVNAFRSNEEDKLTRVQCSNIVSNERKFNLGKECHGIIMHFKQRAELDKEFYFNMDLSEDGTLKSVFWADGRSKYSYCQFGDVLVFDTTYKTNKFSFPFAPFVEVNHHGQSILFGGALLENKTETTFTWLFKQFLKCMNGSPPVFIITDQDLAMGNAIAKVFPKTRHRFCAWHIQKHVLEHLQPLRFRYDDFQDTYKQWIKTPNVEDFESKWEHLKEKYLISKDSCGRSESMHSFFDGFVNSKTMLNDFVQQYDKAVSSRRGVEKDQDFRTLNSKPSLQGDHPIEAMAAKISIWNGVMDQLKEVTEVSILAKYAHQKHISIAHYVVEHLGDEGAAVWLLKLNADLITV